MKKIFLALLISSLTTLFGSGSVLAGGTSDTSGEGYHCYMFFQEDSDDSEKFAQVMINDDKRREVHKKRNEFLDKYENDEDMVLTFQIGNVRGCRIFREPKEHNDCGEC